MNKVQTKSDFYVGQTVEFKYRNKIRIGVISKLNPKAAIVGNASVSYNRLNVASREAKKILCTRKAIHEEKQLLESQGVTDFDKLFLKGEKANKIFLKTINDLLEITYKSDEKFIDIMNSNINLWLDYNKNKTEIGEKSENGIIIETDVFKNKSFPIILKISRHYNTEIHKELFDQEFLFGLKINELRKFIPNFVLTLGKFNCFSHLKETINKSTLCTNQNSDYPFAYILLEDIKGISYSKFIARLNDEQEFFSSIKQICLAMWVAHNKINFVHNDFHFNNILVSPLDKVFIFDYKIKGKFYTVVAKNVFIIIDYGTSYIDVKNYDFKYNRNFPESINFKTPNIIFDIFRFIISAFEEIYLVNLKLRESEKIKNFFIQVFTFFKSIYITDYLDTISSLMKNRYNTDTFEQILTKLRKNLKDKDDLFNMSILYSYELTEDIQKLDYKKLVEILDEYIDKQDEKV
jgi:hypothetical protein